MISCQDLIMGRPDGKGLQESWHLPTNINAKESRNENQPKQPFLERRGGKSRTLALHRALQIVSTSNHGSFN